MAFTDRKQVRTWLDGIDFPADKQQLVDQAERNGAPEEVVRGFRAMPPVEYENIKEVFSSVSIRRDQSDADKAEQAHRHAHSGLAEHERETPVNPIVDELGENRKS
ncbi:DUF2795 domain-containing protein [Brevibacterium limosum]|uniref:DUF2795 domain-containing protein n=1 Tax=Brevibacterium limosum TaxID=2697565 RepID=UPI00142236A2|nr:DUF2795 domain-containing protein [Brevibacterium limosum]